MKKSIEILKIIHDKLVSNVSLDFKRNCYYKINRDSSLVGLIWERGVWKTTMLLQRIKETGQWFYLSADHTVVKSEGLFNIIFYMYENYNIKIFYVDEIHKYLGWQQEVKSIYDSFPDIKLVFSWSSSLDLYKWIVDLWRRALFYNIYPLNFSEFLKYYYDIEIPSFSFEQIIQNHKQISFEYWSKIKDVYFTNYLKFWYYPFSKRISFEEFVQKLQVLLDRIILEDLPVFLNFKIQSLDKLRKLFYFISNIPPSELNFTSLWKKIGLDKTVVENALFLLNKIGVVKLIPKWWNLSDRLRKQYKILLWNPNLYNAYSFQPDIWVIRESFFISQIAKLKDVEIFLPKKWDFVVEKFDKVWYFEIGWKKKRKTNYPENIFIVKDDIKISESDRVIPLWVFGLVE